jgi:hypothetical protein
MPGKNTYQIQPRFSISINIQVQIMLVLSCMNVLQGKGMVIHARNGPQYWKCQHAGSFCLLLLICPRKRKKGKKRCYLAGVLS